MQGFNPVNDKQKIVSQYLWAIPVLVLVLIVYLPSLKNGFITNWDDRLYVLENMLIRRLSFENVKLFFTEPVAGNFHPLTIFSLAIDYHFFELDPYYYHLHNLLHHLLNTFLVYWVVYYLSHKNILAAVFVSLIFGIHPMHVESVAWVSARKDLLYTFWFLTGLLIYVYYYFKKSNTVFILVFICFLFSGLSKPAAVVFPIVLLATDIYFTGKLNKKDIIEKVPLFFVSLAIGILTIRSQGTAIVAELVDFSDKVSFASYAIIMYIIKFFIPFGLNNMHVFPNPTPKYYGFFVLFVIPAMVYLLYVWNRFRRNGFIFGIVFYLTTIALMLQVITVGNAIIAERYTYLSYVGVAFAFYYLIEKGFFRFQINKWTNIFLLILIFLSGTSFSIISAQRIKVWESAVTLWEDAIKKDQGNYIAYNNLGNYYYRLDSLQPAYYNYNKAINYFPDYATAYFNRGLVYFNQDYYEFALNDFEEAVRINPDDEKAINFRTRCYLALGQLDKIQNDEPLSVEKPIAGLHSETAQVYYNRKEYEKAAEEFINAIVIDKENNAGIYLNLGLCYLYLDRLDESVRYFAESLQRDSNKPKAAYNRGVAYFKLGQFDKAIADFERTVVLDPARVDAYKYLAHLYLKKQDYRKVAEYYSEVLKYEPDNAAVLSNRASALYYTGDYAQAVKDAERAIELGYPVDQAFYEKIKRRAGLK